MSLEVVPVEGESYEGRQWGYRIVRDGEAVMHCRTGGTGECWNLGLLDADDHFGPLGGADGDIHVCDLDALIAVLVALRDSAAHREHVARWQWPRPAQPEGSTDGS